MKTNKKSFILLLLFITILFMSIIPKKSYSQSTATINYSFENDVFFDSNNIDNTDSFNIRNYSTITQLYNASYSFESDTDYSYPSGWIITETTGSIQVFPSLDGHRKVLEFNDTGAGNIKMEHTISRDTGTIEYWVNLDGTTNDNWTELFGAGDDLFFYFRDNGKYGYFDGGFIDLASYTANTWYHIKIEFDKDTDWHLWINGVSIDGGGGYGYHGVAGASTFTNIRRETGNAGTGKSYIDGIGQSWLANYTINNNFIPIKEINTNVFQRNRWEFALQAIDVFYELGDDDPSGWTEGELSGDDINIGAKTSDGSLAFNRVVEFNLDGDDPSGTNSLYRNFDVDTKVHNITWSLYFETIDNSGSLARMVISDNNSVWITRIQVRENAGNLILEYYNGIGVVNLRSDLVIDTTYEFNFYVNQYDDIGILRYSVNGVFIASYIIDLYTLNTEGIGRIELLTQTFISAGNDLKFELDYIGLYSNEISLSDEFAWITHELNLGTWSMKDNNLFSMIANGNFFLGITTSGYLVGDSGVDTLKTNVQYSDIEVLYNLYDTGSVFTGGIVPVATFLFYLFGNLSISFIHIEGVLLVQNTNEYSLEFTHGNVDIDVSYFYTSNNRLFFTHISNDTNLEFIQANFSSINVLSDNRAISFSSSINNIAIGNFRIEMTSLTDIIQIPIFETTTKIILTQNTTISKFIILITDNDIDIILGTTSGYIFNIGLVYSTTIGTTILTLSLISMLVPLIMILIPSLALTKFLSKNMFVPLFLLMSIICVITETIPVWLFFIIAICSVMFILVENKKGVNIEFG